MTVRYILIILSLTAAIACNNNSSVQDNTDSVAVGNDTSHQSGWPDASDIMGGDTVPSAETQADTSNSTPKKY